MGNVPNVDNVESVVHEEYLDENSIIFASFDGSFKKEDNKGSFGYIIKTYSNEIARGYGVINNCLSNNIAEYIGLYMVLKKCSELNIENVYIVGDAKSVIDVIDDTSYSKLNTKSKYYKEMNYYVNKIKSILQEFTDIQYNIVERDYNQTTDRLARKVL